jgi:hypothetical protein
VLLATPVDVWLASNAHNLPIHRSETPGIAIGAVMMRAHPLPPGNNGAVTIGVHAGEEGLAGRVNEEARGEHVALVSAGRRTSFLRTPDPPSPVTGWW